MSDEPDSLTLRHLRRLDERIGNLEAGQSETNDRLGILERRFTLLDQRLDSIQTQISRQTELLARIARRLDLVEAP